MTTTTTNKDVNIFGPIGGKDYLKLNAAKRHTALNKQIPNLLGGVPGSPIPRVLPATGRKMANQMTESTRQLRQLAGIAGGKTRIPVSFTGDPLLKSAAEKLLSGSTSNSLRTQKSRKIAQLLRDHSNGQNASYFGKEAAIPLIPAALSTARAAVPAAWTFARGLLGRGAAAATGRAAATTGRAAATTGRAAATTGQAASATGRAAATAGREHYAANAWRQAEANSRAAEAWRAVREAKRAAPQAGQYRQSFRNLKNKPSDSWLESLYQRTGRAAPYLRGTGKVVGNALYGGGLGYGADVAASMTGHDTGGWGSLLGGGIGIAAGAGKGRLGKALSSIPGAKNWEDRLNTLGWMGVGGNLLETNTGGLMNPTKPIQTYNRLKQYERDHLANELGFENAAQGKTWLQRQLLALAGYPTDYGYPDTPPPSVHGRY